MLHSNAQYVALRVVLYIWNKCLFRLRENQSYGPQEQFLRIRKFSVFLSFCVFRFLCVWQRECGRPSNASHGEARQWWVSVGQLWHILHFLNPHTRWLMCCALRKGEKNTSQEGWTRGPSTKLTGQLTMIDTHKQCDHVQTPTLLKDNARVSHTLTQPSPLPYKQPTLLKTLTFINNVSLALTPCLAKGQ